MKVAYNSSSLIHSKIVLSILESNGIKAEILGSIDPISSIIAPGFSVAVNDSDYDLALELTADIQFSPLGSLSDNIEASELALDKWKLVFHKVLIILLVISIVIVVTIISVVLSLK